MTAHGPRRSPQTADCRARLAEFFAYMDGELSAGRCATLERHLAGCECCDEMLTEMRRLIAACRRKGREGVPSSVHARARAAARRLARQTPA